MGKRKKKVRKLQVKVERLASRHLHQTKSRRSYPKPSPKVWSGLHLLPRSAMERMDIPWKNLLLLERKQRAILRKLMHQRRFPFANLSTREMECGRWNWTKKKWSESLECISCRLWLLFFPVFWNACMSTLLMLHVLVWQVCHEVKPIEGVPAEDIETIAVLLLHLATNEKTQYSSMTCWKTFDWLSLWMIHQLFFSWIVFEAAVKDELLRTDGDVTACKQLYETWLHFSFFEFHSSIFQFRDFHSNRMFFKPTYQLHGCPSNRMYFSNQLHGCSTLDLRLSIHPHVCQDNFMIFNSTFFLPELHILHGVQMFAIQSHVLKPQCHVYPDSFESKFDFIEPTSCVRKKSTCCAISSFNVNICISYL